MQNFELEHSFLKISHGFSATLKAENVFVLQLLNSYNCLSSRCKSNTAHNSGLNCTNEISTGDGGQLMRC